MSRHIITDCCTVAEKVVCDVIDCKTHYSCRVFFKKTAESEALTFGDKILIEARMPPGQLVGWHLRSDKVRVQLPLIGVGEIKDETQ